MNTFYAVVPLEFLSHSRQHKMQTRGSTENKTTSHLHNVNVRLREHFKFNQWRDKKSFCAKLSYMQKKCIRLVWAWHETKRKREKVWSDVGGNKGEAHFLTFGLGEEWVGAMTSLNALKTVFFGEDDEGKVHRPLTFLTQISSDGKCNRVVKSIFLRDMWEWVFRGYSKSYAAMLKLRVNFWSLNKILCCVP